MNEMIERVANAMAFHSDRQAHTKPWMVKWDDLARVAIAAMREPTEAMLDAAVARDYRGEGPDTASEHWRAMIDQALR